MIARVLKIVGWVLGALVLVGALAYLLRTNPMGPIAGKRLTGNEVAYPDDWSSCNDHFTIAIESRVEDPHSVTTLCFVHHGSLIVPAMKGSEKQWTANVLADPRVRIKIGERVYPARAERAPDLKLDDLMESIGAKYEQFRDMDPADRPPDVWLFRIGPR